MFYGIKKKIITGNIKKRQAPGYKACESELYQLGPDDDGHINNSYFFSAHTMEGKSIYIRLGLRGDGNTEVWTAYSNGKIFVENEKHLYMKGEDVPLSVECIEPEKLWKVSYNGTMRDVEENGRKMHKGMMECTFTATEKIFDFFYDNDPTTTANALAREKWTKQLFADIGENNQRHYEQLGKFEGKFVLDGEEYDIDMVAGRDHSFGPRRWSYMNKHIWILALGENGMALNISMVSYPALHGLWTGYTTIYGKFDSIAAIESKSDTIAAGHSDGHVLFTITLTSGKKFDVEVFRDENAVYLFDNGEFIFNEGIGHMIVDGHKMRGTVEFSFNKDESRWRD